MLKTLGSSLTKSRNFIYTVSQGSVLEISESFIAISPEQDVRYPVRGSAHLFADGFSSGILWETLPIIWRWQLLISHTPGRYFCKFVPLPYGAERSFSRPRFMLIERRVIKSFLPSCAEARREGRTFELGLKG